MGMQEESPEHCGVSSLLRYPTPQQQQEQEQLRRVAAHPCYLGTPCFKKKITEKEIKPGQNESELGCS